MFCEDIGQLNLPLFDRTRERENCFEGINTDRFLKIFWILIRERAKIMEDPKHIFSYKRSERAQFLRGLASRKVMAQIESIEYFF